MDFILGYLAGWSIAAVVFLIIGLGLVVLEMFTPGFGLFGITGMAALIIAIILSCISTSNPIVYGMITLVLVIVLLVLSGIIIFKAFKKGTSPIILNDSIQAVSGENTTLETAAIVGLCGTCMTYLRPIGKVKINDTLYDAITDGEFIAQGETVIVKEIKGLRIVVSANSNK